MTLTQNNNMYDVFSSRTKNRHANTDTVGGDIVS